MKGKDVLIGLLAFGTAYLLLKNREDSPEVITNTPPIVAQEFISRRTRRVGNPAVNGNMIAMKHKTVRR